MRAPTGSSARYRRSLRWTAAFVYRHSAWLVVVSVCWVVASLPVVTSGVATLGAFSAIRSLRDGDRPRWRVIAASLRRHGLNATLLSFVPLLLLTSTALYAGRYAVTGSIRYLLLSIAGVYLVSFLLLVSLTTVARLSDGDGFVEAVGAGYRWLIRNPLLSAMSMLTMAGIVLAGIVSVVGLVIIVPGVIFSLHLEITDDDATPPVRDDGRVDDGALLTVRNND
ncbi:hypothetical protein V5735_23535 (plasmid) [Haladaptatus sp. SPP-AMP-3]|uniref:hypothetical protein n=1 Tax=Haladaptatus sp. SPP-AMP-3 TaxID=3121295 RepID=UPI003C2FAB29